MRRLLPSMLCASLSRAAQARQHAYFVDCREAEARQALFCQISPLRHGAVDHLIETAFFRSMRVVATGMKAV